MAFGFDFYLWIAVIILNFFFMAKMINRFRKPETEIFGKYFKGVFLFFLIHGVSRICYFIYDYFSNEEYFYELGVIFGIISIVAFMYYIESTIFTKSKHIFFIFGCIGTCVAIASLVLTLFSTPVMFLAEFTQYGTVPVLGIVVPLIYLYMVIVTEGRVRTNSFIVMIGIIFFILGQISHTQAAQEMLPDLVIWLSPICMLLGLCVFYYGLARGQKK